MTNYPAPLGLRALSIDQPWASLIILGLKRYETRGWSTRYRGPVVIHASKNYGPDHSLAADYFLRGLGAQELLNPVGGISYQGKPSLGLALGVADLVDCQRTEELYDDLSPREHAFGNFSPRRFGFDFQNIRLFPEPIPIAGRQRLWFWYGGDLPIDIETVPVSP